MPQTNGAPIQAPRLGAHEVCNPAMSVRIVKLTSYQFRDDSEYTVREFDYRLRWTLYANHDQIRDTAHAHATVEVWSRRDDDWHQVWELSRKVESPYGIKWEPKVKDWNKLLAELAAYATEVLL
jgi:hypothetical protein